jgi:DNA-binding NtrC family response regulator
MPAHPSMDRNKPIFARRKTPAAPKLPRILIVDDDSAGADSLGFMLSHAGYETRVGYSGKEAIEAASQFKPDMLICDVRMPEIDGIQAAIEITKTFPLCRVLLFSGHVDNRRLIDDYQEKGHKFEFVEKPLHPQQLISKLKSALPR